MHRFQPGNENPILNDKLLREAYEAGRQQALNEQSGGGGGADFNLGPLNTSATKFPGGGNRMGMGTNMGGKGTISAGFDGLDPVGPPLKDKNGNPITWPNGNPIYPFGNNDPTPRVTYQLPDWITTEGYGGGKGYGITQDGRTIYGESGLPVFFLQDGYWYPFMA